MQKTAFFDKNPSPQYFLMGKFFKDRTMSKLSSRGFRKCGTFWAYDLFNGSYCCSKSAQGSKSVFVPKNKRCKKKRQGHNFEFSDPRLNQRLEIQRLWAMIQRGDSLLTQCLALMTRTPGVHPAATTTRASGPGARTVPTGSTRAAPTR